MESPALAPLAFLGNSCSRWGCLAGGGGAQPCPCNPPRPGALGSPGCLPAWHTPGHRHPSWCEISQWRLLARQLVSHVGDVSIFIADPSAAPRGSCCRPHQGLGGPRAALPASALIAVTQGAGSSLGGCIVTDGRGWGTGPGAIMGPGVRRAGPLLAGQASGGYLMAGLGAGLDPWPRRGLPGLAQAPVPRPWVAAALPSPLPDSILWPGVSCSLWPHPWVGRHGPPPVTFKPCLGLVSQDARLSEHEHLWEDPGV